MWLCTSVQRGWATTGSEYAPWDEMLALLRVMTDKWVGVWHVAVHGCATGLGIYREWVCPLRWDACIVRYDWVMSKCESDMWLCMAVQLGWASTGSEYAPWDEMLALWGVIEWWASGSLTCGCAWLCHWAGHLQLVSMPLEMRCLQYVEVISWWVSGSLTCGCAWLCNWAGHVQAVSMPLEMRCLHCCVSWLMSEWESDMHAVHGCATGLGIYRQWVCPLRWDACSVRFDWVISEWESDMWLCMAVQLGWASTGSEYSPWDEMLALKQMSELSYQWNHIYVCTYV